MNGKIDEWKSLVRKKSSTNLYYLLLLHYLVKSNEFICIDIQITNIIFKMQNAIHIFELVH